MASTTKTNGQKRHEFHTRLPATVYRHLRAIANLPPVSFNGKRKALLLRIPEAAYARLRKIAITRSSSGDSGAVMSMQGVLMALIEQRYELETRQHGTEALRYRSTRPKLSMAKLVAALITESNVRADPTA